MLYILELKKAVETNFKPRQKLSMNMESSERDLNMKCLPETENSMADKGQQSQDEQIPSSKRQFFETVTIYAGAIGFGMFGSILGPTLLDLQLQTQAKMTSMVSLFTARSVGGLPGALVSGFIIEKFNNWFILGATAATLAILIAIIPFLRNIISLIIVMGVCGAATRLLCTGNLVLLLDVWESRNGPWMQALQLMVGVGRLLGPLLAEPFLSPTQHLEVAGYNDTDGNLLQNSTAAMSSLIDSTTALTTFPEILTMSNSVVDVQSKIWIAYIILSSLFLLTTIGYMAVWVTGECSLKHQRRHKKKDQKSQTSKIESPVIRITILLLIFIFSLFNQAIEKGYMNYLSIYSVTHLDWTKSKGAQVTAAYLGSFLAGRAAGIIFIHYIKPSTLLGIDVLMTAVCILPTTFAAHFHPAVLWVSSVGLGFSVSTIYATIMTWTESYIYVTGHVGALIVIAGSTGDILVPVLIVALFAQFGAGSFVFIMCGASLGSLITFTSMHIIASQHRKRNTQHTM